MTLPPQWEKDALALVEQASPLEGQFFRSVELAYGHPDDVIKKPQAGQSIERNQLVHQLHEREAFVCGNPDFLVAAVRFNVEQR